MSARLLLFLSTVFFALAQASVKLIPQIPAHEIVCFRSILSGFITLYFIRRARLKPFGHNRPMLLVRGLCGTLAMVLYFYTLQTIPLASATSLHYLYPVFTVLLAALLLKERPAIQQWLGICLALTGAWLLTGFDFKIAAVPLAIALISALLDAATFTIIRSLRNEDHALVIVFYLPLVSVLVLLPYTLYAFVTPSGFQWLMMIVIGVFAQAGQYCVTLAYQRQRAADIAYVTYFAPLLAVVLGATVWGEQLTSFAFAGILFIIGGSILNSVRKHKVAVDQKV